MRPGGSSSGGLYTFADTGPRETRAMLRVVNQACLPSSAVNQCPSQFPSHLGRHAFVGEDRSEARSLWSLDLGYGLIPAGTCWTVLTDVIGISADGCSLEGTAFHSGFVDSFRADLESSTQAPEAFTGVTDLAFAMLIGCQWRRVER